MMIKTCVLCRKQFKPPHSHNRFCGRACAVIGRGGRTKKTSAKPNCRCKNCGKGLFRKGYLVNKSKRFFCDKSCKKVHLRTMYAGADNPNYQNAGFKTCEGCGKTYKSYSSRRRFCGVECSQKLSMNEYLSFAKKGLIAEKLCAKELVARGYSVCRSAGSRGQFDVIAVNENEILLIQVSMTKYKSNRFRPKKFRQLQSVPCPANMAIRKQLWVLVDGEGWHTREAV